MNIDAVNRLIDEIYGQVVDIRRKIHQNPELGEEERDTSLLVTKVLNNLDLESISISGYGIMSTIYGKQQGTVCPTVGIRADMDALPLTEKTNLPYSSLCKGKMHACGHDIHTSILLGTSIILSKLKDQLKGNVRLIFQPAEETIGGARQMIEAGVTKNPEVSAIMALHVAPEIPSGKIQMVEGTMNASSTELTIKIKGKTCHGAHPEKGADSIVCASSIVLALQTIVTRNIAAPEPAIISIGSISGGTKGNIISGETILKGIIRALDSKTQSFIKDRICSLCDSVAKGFGCQCEIDFQDSYPALHNDPRLFNIIDGIAKSALGRENVLRSNTPSMGADDFSYFGYQAPSLYYNLGCGFTDKRKNYPLHSELFCPDEECMKTGILMEVIGTFAIIDEFLNNRKDY